jgi:hypothetical protein
MGDWYWDEKEEAWIDRVSGQRQQDDPSVNPPNPNNSPEVVRKQSQEARDPALKQRNALETEITGDHAAALRRNKLLQGLIPKAYNPLGDQANARIRFARDKAQGLQGMAGYRQSGGMQGYAEADAATNAVNPATSDYLKRSEKITSDVYGDLFRRLGMQIGTLGDIDQTNRGYEQLLGDFRFRNKSIDQGIDLSRLANNSGMQRAAMEGVGGAASSLFEYLREKGIL